MSGRGRHQQLYVGNVLPLVPLNSSNLFWVERGFSKNKSIIHNQLISYFYMLVLDRLRQRICNWRSKMPSVITRWPKFASSVSLWAVCRTDFRLGFHWYNIVNVDYYSWLNYCGSKLQGKRIVDHGCIVSVRLFCIGRLNVLIRPIWLPIFLPIHLIQIRCDFKIRVIVNYYLK